MQLGSRSATQGALAGRRQQSCTAHRTAAVAAPALKVRVFVCPLAMQAACADPAKYYTACVHQKILRDDV